LYVAIVYCEEEHRLSTLSKFEQNTDLGTLLIDLFPRH